MLLMNDGMLWLVLLVYQLLLMNMLMVGLLLLEKSNQMHLFLNQTDEIGETKHPSFSHLQKIVFKVFAQEGRYF